MKKIIILMLTIFIVSYTFAQIPNGYYSTAEGLTLAPLKTALYNKIKGHTVRSYPLWEWYDNTDLQSNGKIWDIYTDNCNFTFSSTQCGNYNNVCDCYNNEHSFPKSWFGDVSPMNSDIFHLYPTDGKVNGMRSNFPYGECSTGIVWGNGKLGTSTYPGYTNKVFEPADEYKGDLARTYFYMVTRYENVVANWFSNIEAKPMLNGTSFPAFNTWAINLLLKWHHQDPVSQKEIDRNNKIYSLVQFNRNPFIDHPEYADKIWDPTYNAIATFDASSSISIFPNPNNGKFTIGFALENLNDNAQIEIYNTQGQLVYNTNTSISVGFTSENLNWTNAENGIYIVKIHSKDFIANKRIVIAK